MHHPAAVVAVAVGASRGEDDGVESPRELLPVGEERDEALDIAAAKQVAVAAARAPPVDHGEALGDAIVVAGVWGPVVVLLDLAGLDVGGRAAVHNREREDASMHGARDLKPLGSPTRPSVEGPPLPRDRKGSGLQNR